VAVVAGLKVPILADAGQMLSIKEQVALRKEHKRLIGTVVTEEPASRFISQPRYVTNARLSKW
jgi:hypothetical protein